MEQISLRELVKRGVVRNISTLRSNVNNYPYVTMLNKKSGSLNVYFGKKSAVLIQDNFEVGDNIVAALKDATIIRVKNEETKEIRYKLSIPSPNSKYSTDSELMDVFGIEEVEQEFNIADFQAEFSTKPVEVDQPA